MTFNGFLTIWEYLRSFIARDRNQFEPFNNEGTFMCYKDTKVLRRTNRKARQQTLEW